MIKIGWFLAGLAGCTSWVIYDDQPRIAEPATAVMVAEHIVRERLEDSGAVRFAESTAGPQPGGSFLVTGTAVNAAGGERRASFQFTLEPQSRREWKVIAAEIRPITPGY